MAIPDYQTLMLPLLRQVSDGREYSLRNVVDILADEFKLSNEEKMTLLPSGQQGVFGSRVGWAVTYMKQAGLLVATRRSHFKITERGIDLLRENPTSITAKSLLRYPEYVEFRSRRRGLDKPLTVDVDKDQPPEELIESAYQQMRSQLATELIQIIKNCSPTFFEQLVVDVLVRMGYGGTRRDAGEAVGRSGDGGIDGIIKEDRLGLDAIYIQAKRWDSTVGRPEIQKFVGALQGQRARKGVFITTSNFSTDATTYVGSINDKVVLIDGLMLAELMIDHGVGTSTMATYEIKQVDSNYFEGK